MQRVAIMGQGYVGLPVSLRAVEVGHDVVGFDVDRGRVAALARADSFIDDVTDADVAAILATGRFHPTADPADLEGFDIAVVSVPTPLRDGAPELRYIEDAAELLSPHVRPGCCVILESTTYPGTTEEIFVPRLEKGSGLTAGADFHVGYSPERIDPSNAEYTFRNTPKIVSGIDAASLAAVDAFYSSLVDTTVPVSGVREAELAKLLENTFRHVNIALVNELAMYTHELGIDVWEVIEAAASKPFGFMRFTPGPGVGGHCLPIDPSYLSWRIERQLGVTSRFVVTANDINTLMPTYVVQRVQQGLNRRRQEVNGARVLVLGIAYKKNTSDARETPADPIVRGLLELGADVVVHDDHVGPNALDDVAGRVPLTADEVGRADAIVLVTDHDDVDYDVVTAHGRYVFDTRNRLRNDGVEPL
jgi:UDP-N-acetyl-D-glucosamine dehydrogenase